MCWAVAAAALITSPATCRAGGKPLERTNLAAAACLHGIPLQRGGTRAGQLQSLVSGGRGRTLTCTHMHSGGVAPPTELRLTWVALAAWLQLLQPVRKPYGRNRQPRLLHRSAPATDSQLGEHPEGHDSGPVGDVWQAVLRGVEGSGACAHMSMHLACMFCCSH